MAAAPAVQAADIEFWYGNTGRIETAIQAHCDAFNAAQSAHTITCVGQGGYEAGMQKAIAAYRSQEHPVMIQFFDAGTLDLMLSGAVVPVHTLFDDVDWSDYNTGAKGYYETSKGELFSQPYNGSTLIFYANMEMLNAAGVETMPGTWEEVIAAAEALKANGVDCPVLHRCASLARAGAVLGPPRCADCVEQQRLCRSGRRVHLQRRHRG